MALLTLALLAIFSKLRVALALLANVSPVLPLLSPLGADAYVITPPPPTASQTQEVVWLDHLPTMANFAIVVMVTCFVLKFIITFYTSFKHCLARHGAKLNETCPVLFSPLSLGTTTRIYLNLFDDKRRVLIYLTKIPCSIRSEFRNTPSLRGFRADRNWLAFPVVTLNWLPAQQCLDVKGHGLDNTVSFPMPNTKTIKHSHVEKINNIANTLRVSPRLFNYQFLAYDSALNCFQTLGAGGCETLDIGRDNIYPMLPMRLGYQQLRNESRGSTPFDTKYVGPQAESCATPAPSPAPTRTPRVVNPPPVTTGPAYNQPSAPTPPTLAPPPVQCQLGPADASSNDAASPLPTSLMSPGPHLLHNKCHPASPLCATSPLHFQF